MSWGLELMRKLFSSIFTILILIVLVLNPWTDCAAAVNKQVVILDLPYLDWPEISRDFPLLSKLSASGTAGLAVLPSIPAANGSYSGVIRPILGKTYFQSSSITPVATGVWTARAGAPGGSSPVVVIDGSAASDSFAESAGPLETSSDNSGKKNTIDSILRSYRMMRDRAKIIAVTFSQNRYPVKKRSENSHQWLDFYNELVSRIWAETDFNTTLLMVCFSQASELDHGLTPVFLKGGDFKEGILYSSSTRKKGIVTCGDLRATVLQFLNPGKSQAVLQMKCEPGKWPNLAETQYSLVKNYSVRRPLLTGYGYLLLGLIFLLIIGLILHFPQSILTGMAWSYLFLLTVPVAFLIEAVIDPLDWLSIILYTLGISGALFLGSYLISGKNIFQALIWISFITVGLVASDGLLNGYYEFKSFLGYSVITGARYYGIGNEYMGILLGAYIVGSSLYLQGLPGRRREVLWWRFTFLIGFILIHPNFGADVGGGITALMGLGVANYLWLKRSIRLQELTRLLLLTLGALILAGAWDLVINRNSMSHLGQLLLSVRDHGPRVFTAMVTRKILLNLRLISSTPITLLLIGILSAVPVLCRFPPAALRRLIAKHTQVSAGLTGLAVTALIGFLVNDSGIVSAAMIFMFGFSLILTVILKELIGTHQTSDSS